MSTNYFSIKKSELEIFDSLNDFFLHVIYMHTYISDLILKNKIISAENYDAIIELEEKADDFYRQILADCIWTIQKDQPRASHLRFIISSINSTKDLERAADYAKEIIKLLKEKIIYDPELLKITGDIYHTGINLMHKFHNLYLNKQTHEFTNNNAWLISDYHTFIKTNSKEIIQISKNIQDDKSYQWHINLILIINKIERAVEHIYNIIKAFSYINFSVESKNKV